MEKIRRSKNKYDFEYKSLHLKMWTQFCIQKLGFDFLFNALQSQLYAL